VERECYVDTGYDGNLICLVPLLQCFVIMYYKYGLLDCTLVYGIQYMKKHPSASTVRPVVILLRLQTEDWEVRNSDCFQTLLKTVTDWQTCLSITRETMDQRKVDSTFLETVT
jgi:hypothetical protein